MHWRIQQRGAITFAFFFSVIALRADISLPTAAPSPPPQADDHALRLWRGDRATIPLRGHHSGSGTVTFWIVDPPAHGTLSELRLLGDNRATIVYQNHGAEPAANDRFTYLVRTSGNRVSSVAEVKIVVDEPPPHLQAPGRIEFDQIVAGESQNRELQITNDGGGVLEGRLTVSVPWQLATSDYRVASGRTAKIGVTFRPEEGRDFVGQITLTGSDGALSTASLQGSATSPITLEPAELRIAPPREKDAPRTASVSLTNRTGRPLTLKFSADRKIRPMADITLAPAEEKAIAVVIAAEATAPVDETIVVRGDGFSARLPVAAGALPALPASPIPTPSGAMVSNASPRPSAQPAGPVVARPIIAQPNIVRPGAAAPRTTPTAPSLTLVPVRAQRLEGKRWELRWARPKEPVSRYRIEERFLSLDDKGALQTTWRALAAPDIAVAGDDVTTQISGLDPRQVHSLKLTALAPDGTALWESPVVVLSPPAKPSHRMRNWTLLLGLALFALVALRWRANRAPA